MHRQLSFSFADPPKAKEAGSVTGQPKEHNVVALREGPMPVRRLKIEAVGDFWKGLIKPKIRLMGHWLEQAGFKPGSRVQVTCVSPGVIELRSSDKWDAAEECY
ncbi:MAG: SymE family type I addiction module toxin [Verrucomicrobiota bacterium]